MWSWRPSDQAARLARATRTSPTLKRVVFAPSLRGLGSLPAFAQRQTVTSDTFNRFASVRAGIWADGGRSSNCWGMTFAAMMLSFMKSKSPCIRLMPGAMGSYCVRLGTPFRQAPGDFWPLWVPILNFGHNRSSAFQDTSGGGFPMHRHYFPAGLQLVQTIRPCLHHLAPLGQVFGSGTPNLPMRYNIDRISPATVAHFVLAAVMSFSAL